MSIFIIKIQNENFVFSSINFLVIATIYFRTILDAKID